MEKESPLCSGITVVLQSNSAHLIEIDEHWMIGGLVTAGVYVRCISTEGQGCSSSAAARLLEIKQHDLALG